MTAARVEEHLPHGSEAMNTIDKDVFERTRPGGRARLTVVRAARVGSAVLGMVGCLFLGMPPEAGAQSAGDRLYRYKNEQGRIEISHAVPPDRAASGYEVLDGATGRVLEIVSAQLTPAQIAEKQARERAAEACRDNLDRVRALYGSASDIDVAAEQAELGIETRIGHLNTARALEQRRLEEQERDAAQRERTGRVVTPVMQEEMERSRAQIGAIDAEIAQRRAEQEASRAQFAADRALFEQGECGSEVANP